MFRKYSFCRIVSKFMMWNSFSFLPKVPNFRKIHTLFRVDNYNMIYTICQSVYTIFVYTQQRMPLDLKRNIYFLYSIFRLLLYFVYIILFVHIQLLFLCSLLSIQLRIIRKKSLFFSMKEKCRLRKCSSPLSPITYCWNGLELYCHKWYNRM